MALNATTCYNKAVVAGYGSYPSPLAAAAGVPSAVMVAAAAAAAAAAAGSGSVLSSSSSGAVASSRSGSSSGPCAAAGSSAAAAASGYRVKDFNVPLHVDCSVEYEMPSSAKPPVGGKVEPLLMIHPSYYRKAESRTRSLFVNNMPAAAASSSGRSRPMAGATSGGGRSDAAASVAANVAAADGPPPAKKPYAGPAPGVTASTTAAGVYGMVAGAVAAAAGASQWPPLGSSAEHQHHDGKRTTMDMVQRQYQQHLQASLPPPMMTAALPTDKTHMTGQLRRTAVVVID